MFSQVQRNELKLNKNLFSSTQLHINENVLEPMGRLILCQFADKRTQLGRSILLTPEIDELVLLFLRLNPRQRQKRDIYFLNSEIELKRIFFFFQ